MNNQINLPPNINPQLIESILNVISRDIGVGTQQLGKKKKNKLKNLIRGNLNQGRMQGGPSGSGQQQPQPQPLMQMQLQIMQGATTSQTTETIHISNEDPLIECGEDYKAYNASNFKAFDEHLLTNPFNWHRITILHQERAEKKEILEALNNIVKNEFFVPFAYREEKATDYFLVFNQGASLRRFFECGLKFKIRNLWFSMIIQLGVAKKSLQQKEVATKVLETLHGRMNNANLFGGIDVLDLSDFGSLMELKGVSMCLGNKACLSLLCDQINSIDKIRQQFRVFKFCNNGIKSLESFTKLNKMQIQLLDLSDNLIPRHDELFFVKHLVVKELKITGNPCTKTPFAANLIHGILTSTTAIDDKVFAAQTIPKSSTSTSTQSTSQDNKKKLFGGNGAGDNPILHLEEGILIRGDRRKRQDFAKIKESFNSLLQNKSWTQVTIQHAGFFTKDEILEELISKLVTNFPFYPCYYKSYGDHDEFFLYKNTEALRALMMNDLELVMPNGKKILLSLRLNAADFQDGQVEWLPKIIHVLTKRISNNTFNFNDFANDEEFSKMVVLLTSRSTLNTILEQAKKICSTITTITAQKNGFKTLEGFQMLYIHGKLYTLDLRNNKLHSLVGVSKTTPIKELMLDGNPVCARHAAPREYIIETRSHFNLLEWIDGKKIDKTLNLATMQTFLEKRDAYTFADEFVKTFFTIYDSFERPRILQIYTDLSIFTLSIHYVPQTQYIQQNDLYRRIQNYATYSRNIWKMVNMSKTTENVICGSSVISKVFSNLPKTTHDFLSFCVDVPIYEPSRMVMVKVSGTFEEHGGALNDMPFMLGFTRNFVLTPKEPNSPSYVIANDQLFIHCPPTTAITPDRKPTEGYFERICADLLPTEMEDKKMKFILFQELTELKQEECMKLLEESFWDFKVALATFNTLMDSSEIGNNKFDFK